ncbi:MAG: type II toxin-antitoxin system RelE/ParE family toxin [Proteobacteria bacterium]|nr:type II toxin-antitoxin system RelE/ParE family toxin [Pseudomonadota bacterium]MBU1739550.1 type II toxin-antitoxin system RelE/ParE family toxin [Pseudomonadota bacterium]
MAGFVLTQKARKDLLEIALYTFERWGREQRNMYLNMMDDCFQQLAANPHIGIDCSDIRTGYRKMQAGSHVIFYRAKSTQTIEIVRILHGRMDLETHFPTP